MPDDAGRPGLERRCGDFFDPASTMKHALNPPTPEVRDRMRRAGRADTAPEVDLRRLLFASGLRYRKDHAPIVGLRTRADVVFVSAKVAVYVDGCFWHGCPDHATWPKNNAEFWRTKIETNRERDRRVGEALAAAGWVVVRVWEHEAPGTAADRVKGVVDARSSRRRSRQE